MINIAVCDDEKAIVGQIEEMLYEMSSTHGVPIKVDGFYSGESVKKEILLGTKYDLIYLDIQMESENGITAASNIRKMDENVLLIYVSSYDKYLMDLFRLDVFEFIKKPINEEIFCKVFQEANKKINSKKIYFSYHYKNEEFKVLCSDILYFESAGRKIKINLLSGKIEEFNQKLNEIEVKLAHGKIPFLRIHQSYLVNYYLIKSRSKTEIMLVTGKKLSISPDRQKTFANIYARLLGGEISE